MGCWPLAALREQQEHERVALKGQIDALRTAIDAKNGELAAYHGVVDGFEKRVVALETERDRALSDLQVAQLAQTEAEAAAAGRRCAEGKGRLRRAWDGWRGR
jgi:chromosome segregation ATPase